MFKLRLRYIATAGVLMLSTAAFSLPAFSHQTDRVCKAAGGGSTMGMMDQMPMMGGGHMGMMGKYEALGLSKEQKGQMNDIQHQLRKQHWAIMGEMIDLHAALREAHAGDRPDQKAVGAVYGKIFDLKRQMIEAEIDAKNKKKDVLTEEQLAQMEKMKHKRGGMMQGRGGMMQGRGGMMQGQGGTMQQGG